MESPRFWSFLLGLNFESEGRPTVSSSLKSGGYGYPRSYIQKFTSESWPDCGPYMHEHLVQPCKNVAKGIYQGSCKSVILQMAVSVLWSRRRYRWYRWRRAGDPIGWDPSSPSQIEWCVLDSPAEESTPARYGDYRLLDTYRETHLGV